jgi:hypothetical protein
VAAPAPKAATPSPTVRPTVSATPSSQVTVVTVRGALPPTPVAAPCPGNAGSLGADGLPRLLPRTIRFAGLTYAFTAVAEPAATGVLTHVGCIGAFETVTAASVPKTTAIFLRLSSVIQPGAPTLFRFDAKATYTAGVVISGSAQLITIGNQSYAVSAQWTRTIYSSVSVLLYVADPSVAAPGRIIARTVDTDQIGEYKPAGSDVTPSATAVQAAAAAGLNPDLTFAGQRYVLVNVWQVVGATSDGWVTLYAPPTEGTPTALIGIDPRVSDLLIYGAFGS